VHWSDEAVWRARSSRHVTTWPPCACVCVRVCVCVCVKSTQLAAPALVSRHVAILVPDDIDLCRKREWDLTDDHFINKVWCPLTAKEQHFPLKTVHLKVCQCTIVDVRRTMTLFQYLLIQNRTVHSPTFSLMTRTIDPSSPMAQSVCVCVCVCACVRLAYDVILRR